MSTANRIEFKPNNVQALPGDAQTSWSLNDKRIRIAAESFALLAALNLLSGFLQDDQFLPIVFFANVLIVYVQLCRWIVADTNQPDKRIRLFLLFFLLLCVIGPLVVVPLYFLIREGRKGILSILQAIGCAAMAITTCVWANAIGALLAEVAT